MHEKFNGTGKLAILVVKCKPKKKGGEIINIKNRNKLFSIIFASTIGAAATRSI